MKQIIVIILAVCLFPDVMSSQGIISSGFDETVLKMRVKQLDEFVSRFNYEKDIEGKSINNKQDTAMRKRYIINLFNKDLFVDLNDSLKWEYLRFVETVINPESPVYLHFSDSNWQAEAVCQAIFKGKPTLISLFLKTDKVSDNEYKWAISSVEGEMFNLKPNKQNQGIRISPVDNELGFMNISDIFSVDNCKNIVNYSITGYSVDKLSAFNTLVYNGLLKIEHVRKIIYHFEQAPDYIFTVEHFERNSDNVGWLISSLINLKNKRQ
jgi:hypothetical protein